MPTDPVPESLGARRPTEESIATVDELGGGERLASMVDDPTAVPGEMAGAVGSSKADAGVANAMPESGAEKSVEPEEQAACPKTSEGVVGHAVRPPSPLVVPPVVEEEDEVEEIEHEES